MSKHVVNGVGRYMETHKHYLKDYIAMTGKQSSSTFKLIQSLLECNAMMGTEKITRLEFGVSLEQGERAGATRGGRFRASPAPVGLPFHSDTLFLKCIQEAPRILRKARSRAILCQPPRRTRTWMKISRDTMCASSIRMPLSRRHSILYAKPFLHLLLAGCIMQHCRHTVTRFFVPHQGHCSHRPASQRPLGTMPRTS